ncbi:hypothetical protein CR513_42038, partial [Mucuna pruriens]
MPYAELLPHLICNSLVTMVPLKPIQHHTPRVMIPMPNVSIMRVLWDMPGLKHKFQDLIDMGWLSFKENSLNIGNNSLPEHNGSSINVIMGEGDYMVKRAKEVQTPMKDVFRELMKHKIIRLESGLMNVGLVRVDKRRSEGIATAHEENK